MTMFAYTINALCFALVFCVFHVLATIGCKALNQYSHACVTGLASSMVTGGISSSFFPLKAYAWHCQKNINLWWQVNPTKLSSLAFLYCKRAQTTSSPNAVLCKGELRNTQAPHQILAAAVSWSFFDPQLSLSLVGPAVSGARSQYGIAMHHAHPKVLAQK